MRERTEPSTTEPVRCLACDALYIKPAGGGTVRDNPGCPDCGYAGWVAASNLTPIERHHFDEDRRRRRSA